MHRKFIIEELCQNVSRVNPQLYKLPEGNLNVFSILIIKCLQSFVITSPPDSDNFVTESEDIVNESLSVLLYFLQHVASQCAGKKSQLSLEFKNLLDLFLADYLVLTRYPGDFPIIEHSLPSVCTFFAKLIETGEVPMKSTSIDFLGHLVTDLEERYRVDNGALGRSFKLDFKLTEGNIQIYKELYVTVSSSANVVYFAFH